MYFKKVINLTTATYGQDHGVLNLCNNYNSKSIGFSTADNNYGKSPIRF